MTKKTATAPKILIHSTGVTAHGVIRYMNARSAYPTSTCAATGCAFKADVGDRLCPKHRTALDELRSRR